MLESGPRGPGRRRGHHVRNLTRPHCPGVHWRERGTAFGVYGAVIGGAVAIGPLVGGALTSGIGWRWIFFVNIPVGAVAVVITLAKVEDSRDRTETRHRLGRLHQLFGLTLHARVRPRPGQCPGVEQSHHRGLLVGRPSSWAVFLLAEWRGRNPMLDLGLFRRPAMVGVSLTAFILSSSIFAMLLYVTFYLQDVLGYGPLAAGLRFLPLTLLSFVVAPVAGKLTLRVHSRYLLGWACCSSPSVASWPPTSSPSSTWSVLLPGFIVAGIGVGITNPVVASATVSVVPPERSGMASGASNTFRQVGIATGIAALGAVFLSQIRSATTSALGGHSRWPAGCGSCGVTTGCSGRQRRRAPGGRWLAITGNPESPPRCLPGRLHHHSRPPDDNCHGRVADRGPRCPHPGAPARLRSERSLYRSTRRGRRPVPPEIAHGQGRGNRKHRHAKGRHPAAVSVVGTAAHVDDSSDDPSPGASGAE